MKFNNKGYLIIEVIVAGVLTFTMAYFLINLTLKIRSKYDDVSVETIMLNDKAVITNEIMNDIVGNKVTNVERISNGIKINFEDGSTKDLMIVDNTITYGTYSKQLSENAVVGSINIERDGNYFLVEIPITTKYSNNDYGIKIVGFIDSTTSNSSNSLYGLIKRQADTTTQIDFSLTSEGKRPVLLSFNNSELKPSFLQYTNKLISHKNLVGITPVEGEATNGIYTTISTDNGNPVYYYRGNVDNHVIFANYCWRIVRTTETDGIKIIYDGVPSNGQCNNSGEYTTIGNLAFNNSYDSLASVGYMYGTMYSTKIKIPSSLSGTIVFGNNITYSNGTYTLTDTYTVSDMSNWDRESYTVGSRYHYTCFTDGSSCTTVNYINRIEYTEMHYYELTGGKNHLDILNEMLDNSSNTTNSTVKTKLDNWYQTNLNSYTSQLEDTVFCNDRSYNVTGSVWDKDSNVFFSFLHFNAYTRFYTNSAPTLQCSNNNDKFTVNENNGNGDLTYPIGLLSVDEIAFAGGVYEASNSSYYLYNGITNWIGSPSYFYSLAYGFFVDSDGCMDVGIVGGDYGSSGVRPVVSLKPGTIVSGGIGTATEPYIVG